MKSQRSLNVLTVAEGIIIPMGLKCHRDGLDFFGTCIVKIVN